MNGRNILILGAGMISPPLVRHLLQHTGHRMCVAALDTSRVQAVADGNPRVTTLKLDLEDLRAVEGLMAEADLLISLLPASHNPRLARLCVQHRVPFVNTSYAAPEMWALDEEARKSGVLLLNEIGLDPGIDHLSAVHLIQRATARGGCVRNFLSVCGGFPAPDANNNPWGYKFSWFPRAVFLATLQGARFLRKGQVVALAPGEVFGQAWAFALEDLGLMEVYANRDALAYREPYRLVQAEGIFRGTLRYPGWCETIQACKRLGWLDPEPIAVAAGTTYGDLTLRRVPPGRRSRTADLAAFLGVEGDHPVLARLEWAGLLSDRPIPSGSAPPLDLFVDRVVRLLAYRSGERDMVHLEHRLDVTFPDGHREEVRARLTQVGERWGDSAMSRSVALPAVLAARMILDGTIQSAGVQIPVTMDIAQPVLQGLSDHGLGLDETWIPHSPSPLASEAPASPILLPGPQPKAL